MNAEEIRKFYGDNIAGEVDGSLDEHNLCNALLGEIAAQLAEINERPNSGRKIEALMEHGDAMAKLLALDPDTEPFFDAAAKQAISLWKADRGLVRPPKYLAPLGHTADCPVNPLTGSGVPIGPHYCGHCGGYIGK